MQSLVRVLNHMHCLLFSSSILTGFLCLIAFLFSFLVLIWICPQDIWWFQHFNPNDSFMLFSFDMQVHNNGQAVGVVMIRG
jgi:hypothetical protein